MCNKTTCSKRDLCERYMNKNISLSQSWSYFSECKPPTFQDFKEIDGKSMRKEGFICVVT